jgi:hypothetical protein
MADGTTRAYYMGGNGPHSGARNTSFALVTLGADRFAGVTDAEVGGVGTAGGVLTTTVSSSLSKTVNVTGATMIVTLDVLGGGSGRRRGGGYGVIFSIPGAGTEFAASVEVTEHSPRVL